MRDSLAQQGAGVQPGLPARRGWESPQAGVRGRGHGREGKSGGRNKHFPVLTFKADSNPHQLLPHLVQGDTLSGPRGSNETERSRVLLGSDGGDFIPVMLEPEPGPWGGTVWTRTGSEGGWSTMGLWVYGSDTSSCLLCFKRKATSSS